MKQETIIPDIKELVEICIELKAIALSKNIFDTKKNVGTPEERAEERAIIDRAQNILGQFE